MRFGSSDSGDGGIHVPHATGSFPTVGCPGTPRHLAAGSSLRKVEEGGNLGATSAKPLHPDPRGYLGCWLCDVKPDQPFVGKDSGPMECLVLAGLKRPPAHLGTKPMLRGFRRNAKFQDVSSGTTLWPSIPSLQQSWKWITASSWNTIFLNKQGGCPHPSLFQGVSINISWQGINYRTLKHSLKVLHGFVLLDSM